MILFNKIGYHIVREADLLSAYDFDRCMIYQINKNNGNIETSFNDAEMLFNNRVFKHFWRISILVVYDFCSTTFHSYWVTESKGDGSMFCIVLSNIFYRKSYKYLSKGRWKSPNSSFDSNLYWILLRAIEWSSFRAFIIFYSTYINIASFPKWDLASYKCIFVLKSWSTLSICYSSDTEI